MENKYQKIKDTEVRIQELTVLQNELSSLKNSASVYKQQRNSNILFKCNKPEVFVDTKRELTSLQREYERLNKM